MTLSGNKEFWFGMTFRTEVKNLPYAVCGERGDDPMVWLPGNLAAIDDIKELRDEPELRGFVEAVNADGLSFATFRTSCETLRNEASVTKKLYVGLMFRDVRVSAQLGSYFQLTCYLSDVLMRRGPESSDYHPFDLVFQQHNWKERGAVVYTMDVNMEVEGLTELEVRLELGRRFSLLQDALCL